VEDGETGASLAFRLNCAEIDAIVIANRRHPAMPAYLIASITVTDPLGFEHYAPLLALRQRSAVSSIILVEGYVPLGSVA
jgi:hypothetical protein